MQEQRLADGVTDTRRKGRRCRVSWFSAPAATPPTRSIGHTRISEGLSNIEVTAGIGHKATG